MEEKTAPPDSLVAFREVSMELDNAYSLFAKACGLSDAAYCSLVSVYEGIVTQSQISDQLFFSRQTLNSAFKQLRMKGLIRLEPYEENQRSKQAFLTDEGKWFAKTYVSQMHRVEERAWEQMEGTEQEMLTQLARKFNDLIQGELQTTQLNKI